jgi:hypothetical protein
MIILNFFVAGYIFLTTTQQYSGIKNLSFIAVKRGVELPRRSQKIKVL